MQRALLTEACYAAALLTTVGREREDGWSGREYHPAWVAAAEVAHVDPSHTQVPITMDAALQKRWKCARAAWERYYEERVRGGKRVGL
jgi:hypothetical protein